MRREYVARAEAGTGWRIWNRRTRRPWGNYFSAHPEKLLLELNGPRREAEIVRLQKLTPALPAPSSPDRTAAG